MAVCKAGGAAGAGGGGSKRGGCRHGMEAHTHKHTVCCRRTGSLPGISPTHPTARWWMRWRARGPGTPGTRCAPAAALPPAAGPAHVTGRGDGGWVRGLRSFGSCSCNKALNSWSLTRQFLHSQHGPDNCAPPPHLAGEPRRGVGQDGGHAAVVGAPQEERARPRLEVVRHQARGGGVGLEAGVGRGVAPQHQLQRQRQVVGW